MGAPTKENDKLTNTNLQLSIYDKSEFLKQRCYDVIDGKVTKKGTELNSSINYAFNLENNKKINNNGSTDKREG